ncbi:MAG: hypothetical protein J1F13_03830 [Prevotellaceae bacterium]|nr:hypothetical protein [Prevotellaceae bacterium]
MIDLLIVGAIMYGGFKLCKKGGKAIADAKFSKTCPCCGTKVKPDGDCVSNIYWKGTGGLPVYNYTCPKCKHKFDNRPY